MYSIGIDIGSTQAKVFVAQQKKECNKFIMPTGYSSLETSKSVLKAIEGMGIKQEECFFTATGYGRVSVPYAKKTITEITCHAKGVYFLTGKNQTIIDIGGQDTKVITERGGAVSSFTMNDRCAAGTGRFIQHMADTLGLSISDLLTMSEKGDSIAISSMCTVFAESEVISLIGSGANREGICGGVLDSVVSKVSSLVSKHGEKEEFFLSGGLSLSPVMVNKLKVYLKKNVETHEDAIYAGAIGASIIGGEILEGIR